MSTHIELLKKYNIWAKKSLGQNFLVDDSKIQAIAEYCELKGKNIVEVGPGYGALTEKLIDKNPDSLTLIELDQDMISVLQDRFLSPHPNPLPEVEGTRPNILHQDILQYHPEFEKYSVIANIPYYITSPILRHFLYDVEKPPEEMLILMQQDVGDKILATSPPAPPLKGESGKKMKLKSSVLGLFIAKKAYAKEVLLVPKECFYPVPKVESSVLYFELHDNYKNIDDTKFLEIIKQGFSSPRKKLIKNFIHAGLDKDIILKIFLDLNIEQQVRGEDLDIGKWCELVERINHGL